MEPQRKNVQVSELALRRYQITQRNCKYAHG